MAQVILALKNLANSILAESSMKIITFTDFEKLGKLPRSCDRKAQDISVASVHTKLVFISHRWLRPWKTREECERNKHVWAGMAHPDDNNGAKYRLICAGVRRLAEEKGWDIHHVGLWLDFCCVEQDDAALLQAGIASLRGYISVCDAVLIPTSEVPVDAAWTVDKIPGEYGERAWTRLESMSFYAVSTSHL